MGFLTRPAGRNSKYTTKIDVDLLGHYLKEDINQTLRQTHREEYETPTVVCEGKRGSYMMIPHTLALRVVKQYDSERAKLLAEFLSSQINPCSYREASELLRACISKLTQEEKSCLLVI